MSTLMGLCKAVSVHRLSAEDVKTFPFKSKLHTHHREQRIPKEKCCALGVSCSIYRELSLQNNSQNLAQSIRLKF